MINIVVGEMQRRFPDSDVSKIARVADTVMTVSDTAMEPSNNSSTVASCSSLSDLDPSSDHGRVGGY